MKFVLINKDPIFDYKRACLITKGKEITKCSYPKDEVKYWIDVFCSMHSPVRFLHFTVTDELPKSVIMQLIRATKGHPQPEVQSSRPDWTGKERSTDPYENKLVTIDYTPESFIQMMKQRLCQCTEQNTRKIAYKWRDELAKSQDPFFKALGICCLPKCMYFGGRCNEPFGCKKFPQLSELFYDSNSEN